MPPPSSGGVAIGQIIFLMEYLKAFDHDLSSPTYNHLLIESMKHAFADRAAHMADPSFVRVPVDDLLDKDYLLSIASKINLKKTQESSEYGSFPQLPEDDGTSHLCVVDERGMVVVATETINTSFGSLAVVSPYDFLLNNEMDDFSSLKGTNIYGLVQSDKNLPEPGKRPLSSMTPVILMKDKMPALLVGASGGPRIITSVVQSLLNNQWHNLNPIEAIARGRLHHQWKPDVIYVEEFSQKSISTNELELLGHEVRARPTIGVVQMIEIKDGLHLPASDPRKGGRPAGINSN